MLYEIYKYSQVNISKIISQYCLLYSVSGQHLKPTKESIRFLVFLPCELSAIHTEGPIIQAVCCLNPCLYPFASTQLASWLLFTRDTHSLFRQEMLPNPA